MASPAVAGARDVAAASHHGSVLRRPPFRDHLQAGADGAVAWTFSGSSNEICIHPGFPAPTAQTISGNPTAPDRFATSRFRQSEHDALIDPEAAEIVRRRGLTLMSFTGAIKEPI